MERKLTPALYWRDVFQEAAFAYVKRTRYMAKHPDAQECMPTVIKRHLGRAFLDIHGVHLRTAQRYTYEEVEAAKRKELETSQEEWCEDDSILRLDIERWKSTLAQQDRAIFDMLIDNVPPTEIARRMNLHRNTCDYRRKVIRRSFMEYFKEAG